MTDILNLHGVKIDRKNPTPEQVSAVIRAQIIALGGKAPAFGKTYSIDELRAYLRLVLEPYLISLKNNGVIKRYLIGISPVWIFYPKLKITLSGGKTFEMGLHGVFPIG